MSRFWLVVASFAAQSLKKMNKKTLLYGLYAGLILASVLTISTLVYTRSGDFSGGMVVGYTSMVVAFAFTFVGIKNYRDQAPGGQISFGKAIQVGLWITLIASSMYVMAWLVDYYMFMPDFMEKYTAHVIFEAKAAGASQAEIDKQLAEMAPYKEMYKNPLFVVLLTYMEVLPVGLVFTLLSAFILKKKTTAS